MNFNIAQSVFNLKSYEIIDLPGFTVAARIGRLGSVMWVWDATNGLSAGVVAVVAWMGIGMTVFDLRAPSSLMAAIKAGTRTGSGNWKILGWG